MIVWPIGPPHTFNPPGGGSTEVLPLDVLISDDILDSLEEDAGIKEVELSGHHY